MSSRVRPTTSPARSPSRARSNADLTVALSREPEGEWVCLEASTWPEPTGVGLAESRLHDARGPIGWALQSLLVEPRAG